MFKIGEAKEEVCFSKLKLPKEIPVPSYLDNKNTIIRGSISTIEIKF